MDAEKIARRVGEDFCRTARWPAYIDLDLELLDYGGIEPLLDRLEPDVLVVWGSDDRADLRFASLEAYRRYSPCADVDLGNFGRSASIFASIAASSAGAKDPLSLDATALQRRLEIGPKELARLCELLDQFGGNLQTGGGRGERHDQWSFRVPPTARYFQGVSSVEEFLEREHAKQVSGELRGRREWRRRSEPYGAAVVDTDTEPCRAEKWSVRLHPAVEAVAAKLYLDGHFANAVRAAAQRLEAFLQDHVGDHLSYGVPLVGRVLGGESPPLRLNPGATRGDKAEQSGYLYLSNGILSAFKNVYSHGPPRDIEANLALLQLCAISAVWLRLESEADMHHESHVGGDGS